MILTAQHMKLLNEVFSATLKFPKGIDLARFRADNEEFIPEIDQLEQLGYLQRNNNLYYISPLTLAYLAKDNPDAQSMVQKCGLVFGMLQGEYRNNLNDNVLIPDIAVSTGLSDDDVRATLRFIKQTPILAIFSEVFVAPSEVILRYKSFEEILKEQEDLDKRRYAQTRERREHSPEHQEYPAVEEVLLSVTSSKANWEAIKSEFGTTKIGFGRRINFIRDPFKRKIIFRDVEQAFVLASLGFSKPAVILAGSVIEELLRLYLDYKKINPNL